MKKNKDISHSTLIVLEEAERVGVKWQVIPGTQIITLSYNGHEESFHYQIPSTTSALGVFACDNKKITSNLLKQAGVRVPHGYRITRSHTDEYHKQVYKSLKKPLVVKPTRGYWGDAVTTNIGSFVQFTKALERALSFSKRNASAVAQEMFFGEEYRVVASREQVFSVVKRVPANVVGDGKSPIRKLIWQKNRGPLRHPTGNDKSHVKIRMDKRLRAFIAQQGLDLESVPKKDQVIYLRKVSNISQGGDAIDVTDQVHKSVKDITLRAIQAIPGLSFAGVDFMTTDISASQSDDKYVIIEINSSPGFSINDFPFKGKGRNVARSFLELMFPELKMNS